MEYLALIAFSITACVTPGPNNAMIMASGLNYGIRRSLPHYLGICLGFPTMVVAVGLGVSRVFEQFPALHTALKILGAIYLSFLAYKIATAEVSVSNNNQGKPLTFLQAAAFQWVNPKAWALAIGATVTYTVMADSYTWQVLVIACFFLLFGSPCIALWLWFGVRLKSILQEASKVRLFNRAMALLLMASLIPVFRDLFSQFTA